MRFVNSLNARRGRQSFQTVALTQTVNRHRERKCDDLKAESRPQTQAYHREVGFTSRCGTFKNISEENTELIADNELV